LKNNNQAQTIHDLYEANLHFFYYKLEIPIMEIII